MVSAIFFDFDGVLVDSVEIKAKAFGKLFECYGPEIREKVMEHHLNNGGLPRNVKISYYYEYFLKQPLSENKLNGLCSDFSELVMNEVVNAPEILAAEEFIIKHFRLCPCFVVSATPDAEIKEIILRRGWTEYFKEICGSPPSKADTLRLLLDKYYLSPADCIYFGDSSSDYEAATACSIHFIGVASGEGTPLIEAHPEINWIRNFTEFEF
jgi:beta-phosphoglucomutase-like phosphatase (HAD superfamily)